MYRGQQHSSCGGPSGPCLPPGFAASYATAARATARKQHWQSGTDAQWYAASLSCMAAVWLMADGFLNRQSYMPKPPAEDHAQAEPPKPTPHSVYEPSSSLALKNAVPPLMDRLSELAPPPETPALPKPDVGGFRTIRRAEVEQHKTPETGIWVTFGEGVYDITEFVKAHPGGSHRIMLAAGGPVEPYWAMYAQHRQPQVQQILAELRIGTLPEDERVVADVSNPYANDPKRSDAIRVRNEAPFNGEAPLDSLFSHITPNDKHFVRHHLPVPDALESAFELRLVGDDIKAGASDGDGVVALSLDELKKFAKHDVTVTLQCAGNRRSEMSAVRGTRGLSWEGGAISTAVWSGALLRDVLCAYGVQPGPDARHVEFVGLDADGEGQRYAASIPIEKALAEDGDVVLAYEMNGEPIPRDHGFPLRAVVPGVVAARSVKWVEKIVVRPDESESHWQQEDYKGFCPDEDWENLDWSKAPAIQEVPVTSAVLRPTPQDSVPPGATSIHVAGYAVSGGGRPVIRVDVSVDGGKTWRAAQLESGPEDENARYHRAWAWKHWKVDVPLSEPAKTGDSYQVVCKAVDDAYNVQPDSFGPIYNARGVLATAWHRVNLSCPDVAAAG